MSRHRNLDHSRRLPVPTSRRKAWGKKQRLLEAIKLEEVSTGRPIPDDLTPQELLDRLAPHFDRLGYREKERPRRRHVYFLRTGR